MFFLFAEDLPFFCIFLREEGAPPLEDTGAVPLTFPEAPTFLLAVDWVGFIISLIRHFLLFLGTRPCFSRVVDGGCHWLVVGG